MSIKQVMRCFVIVLFLTFISCASPKKIVYLQNASSNAGKSNTSYELLIQPDDMVQIVVSAENPEVAAPYNLKSNAVDGAMAGQSQGESYLVDKNGEIDFPQIGKIQLAGLSRSEAKDKIVTILKDHISNPSIQLKIVNFKISVLGEVHSPGVQNIASERVTLLEALSKAGDLTIYGKRKNIMLIREKGGEKTIQRVDITDANFINSPYYYLAQNDVVYVEPNRTQVNNSAIGSDIRTVITVLTFAVSVILIITK